MTLDLETFAGTYKPQRAQKCWACSIPEVGEINKGRGAGLAVRLIRAWLIEKKGYSSEDATIGKLYGHFNNGHHRER